MRVKSESGAMVVMVAIALVALTFFSAIVLDYGVVWASRAQAQNAADAGALSAAWWLFDNPTDFTGAAVAARKLANANAVWGENPQTPNILVQTQLTCPPLTGGGNDCLRVDVMRGAVDRNGTAHTNVLPTFFANLGGITSQKIQATAIAQITAANGTGCMRPWFMMDHYTDADGNGVYNSPPDSYTNPGYSIPADIGTIVHFHENASPSGYGQIDVGSGGAAIKDAIEQCVGDGSHYHIGQIVPTKPGGTVGPEKQGIDDVMSWDLGASYDIAQKKVINSCADTTAGCSCSPYATCPNGKWISPRVAIVALCDPSQADCAGGGANNGSITITNFLSFLLLGRSGGGNDLVIDAELIDTAGEIDTGGAPSPAAFLHVIRLVR